MEERQRDGKSKDTQATRSAFLPVLIPSPFPLGLLPRFTMFSSFTLGRENGVEATGKEMYIQMHILWFLTLPYLLQESR